MRRLRWIAILLTVTLLAGWLVLGANRGWTKTTHTRMEKDPVTDIDFPVIEKRFMPGVDLLGAGLLVAAVLASLSFVQRRNS